MSSTVERFQASDGVSLAYRSWGMPSRSPVILQHGFASDSLSEWAAPGVIDALVSRGRHVLAIDARGHGLSESPHDPDRYGEVRMARDLAELFGNEGFDSVDLVGYSMGAIVALLVAAQSAVDIRRLVVGGIGCGVVECGGLDTRVVDSAVLARAFLTDNPAHIADAGLREWRHFADSTGADHLALGAVAASIRNPGVPLKDVTSPVLVLAGEDDPFAQRPDVLARALPQANLVMVSGDHTTARFSPAFTESILGFFERNDFSSASTVTDSVTSSSTADRAMWTSKTPGS